MKGKIILRNILWMINCELPTSFGGGVGFVPSLCKIMSTIYGELIMRIVKETWIWIIEKINFNSENEIYCICNDYDIFKYEMQNICDEDADYIFNNDCIISPRGIEYKGFCTKYIEKIQ